MIITNFKKLAKTELRKKALLIAEAGYEAINIEKEISRRIRIKNDVLEIKSFDLSKAPSLKINLRDFKRIFVIGIGKGSALASVVFSKKLKGKLNKCLSLDVTKIERSNQKIKNFLCTHPLPSAQNIIATKEIIELAKNLNKDDLLVNFICGGGSALMCASVKEMENFCSVSKTLTMAGADIIKLNTVRKHLSEVKGGGLARMAYPATVVSLIVSDVLGDDLSMVASGPTVLDKTTIKDAQKIWKKYSKNRLAQIIFRETSKDKKYFSNVLNILFLSNKKPILEMFKKAKKLGFKPKIYSLSLRGEAQKSLLPIIKNIKSGEVILAAGETTVNLKKYQDLNWKVGRGGRNQEVVLGALAKLRDKSIVFISFASDGRDNGNSAGAIGDFLTLKKADEARLKIKDYLIAHDSSKFFEKTGDLLYTKKTNFNVSDLMIVLKDKGR